MYTPSLYTGLISYLISESAKNLVGKKVALFSYGSGLASSMYSVTVTKDVGQLQPMLDKLMHIMPTLERRQKVAPKEFSEILEIREHNNHKAPLEPSGSIDGLFPGTYYLKSVDHMHRRLYDRVPK